MLFDRLVVKKAPANSVEVNVTAGPRQYSERFDDLGDAYEFIGRLMTSGPPVYVCASCLCASCAAGVDSCPVYDNSGRLATRTRFELEQLGNESSAHWDSPDQLNLARCYEIVQKTKSEVPS